MKMNLDRMKYKLQVWAMLAFMVFGGGLWAQEGVAFAGDVHLKGLLGGKLKIEMMLEVGHEKPFFSNNSKECIDLEGEYYYRTQVLPIYVKGRLCPANGTFFLAVKDQGAETERFEGKWDPKNLKLRGTWTLKKTGKTMPFELVAAEKGIPTATLKAYYRLLRDQLTSESHAEGAKIEDAQWSATNGGTISNFEPSWGGDLDYFAPERLEFSTRYTSTARSSDYDEVYQLLPSTTGVYVAYYFGSYTYEKGEMGDEEAEGTSYCEFAFNVYKLTAEDYEEVTAQVLPADVKIQMEASGGEYVSCVGRLIADGVLFPSGEKLYWDGTKYVR
jgi:hypothetical protein